MCGFLIEKVFRNFPSVDFQSLTPDHPQHSENKQFTSFQLCLPFHQPHSNFSEKNWKTWKTTFWPFFSIFTSPWAKVFHVRTLDLFFHCDCVIFICFQITSSLVGMLWSIYLIFLPSFFVTNSIRLWYQNWYLYYAIFIFASLATLNQIKTSTKSFLLAKYHQKSHVKIT